jgi:hypothetical protein
MIDARADAEQDYRIKQPILLSTIWFGLQAAIKQFYGMKKWCLHCYSWE